MKNIAAQVRNTIRREKLLAGGEKVLVALSGGADSVSLFYLLNLLKKEFNISLVIAHLNHSLRGAEGDRDESFVKEIGAKWRVETFTEKIDVAKYKDENGLSIEAAAREVRYKFLRRIANKIEADKIATGHTADDQAETVLMRFLRGSGASGLKGIPYARENIIRPLIDVRRSQIIEFLGKEGIEYIEDSTNMDLSMTRNKLRHDLIPKLIQDYNPNIVETLHSISNISRGDDSCLEAIISEEIRGITNREGDGFIEFNLKPFSDLHIALKRRVLRRGIEHVKGNLRDIAYSHIEEILSLIDLSNSPKRIDLPGNIFFYLRYGRIGIYRRESLPGYPKFETEIVVPGETSIPELGLRVSVQIVEEGRSLSIKNDEQSLEQVFDVEIATNGLSVRNRRDGDRFYPHGVKGSKKIKDYFIDEKICREERDGIPIFVSGEEIIWIAGYRRSSVGLVKERKKGGISIRITPL